MPKHFFVTVEGETSIARPPYSGAQEGGQRNKKSPHRINGEITEREIRVIDADGEMRGIMSSRDALLLAEESGLDLVEISPDAQPPVCKVLDYGKYRFEMKKKAAESRKKQKVVELKEIKFRPGVQEHDFQIKIRNARSFLEHGDKVKVTLRFRGREMAHQDIARALLQRIREELDELGKVVSEPSFEGRQMVMIFAPK